MSWSNSTSCSRTFTSKSDLYLWYERKGTLRDPLWDWFILKIYRHQPACPNTAGQRKPCPKEVWNPPRQQTEVWLASKGSRACSGTWDKTHKLAQTHQGLPWSPYTCHISIILSRLELFADCDFFRHRPNLYWLPYTLISSGPLNSAFSSDEMHFEDHKWYKLSVGMVLSVV